MDSEIKKDFEEDEELSALRLAALATLKQRSTQNDKKSNQRSNLIVINPVSPNENSYSKESTTSLALPQHKWYNSGNEDSMSPKTFRRTGPSRFNRHESDSDDSESDFEKSDDSGSNETVLQDEPSEKFSSLTSESARFEDVNDKRRISEHRLSFSALDSQQNHDVDPEKTTSVYNSLKCHSFENPDARHDISLRTAQIHNDTEQAWRGNKMSSGDHNKFEMKSPISENHELSKQKLHSTSRNAEMDYEHQYVKNLDASQLNNAWNYRNVNKDYLYSNDDQYNSGKNSKYQNVEAMSYGDLKIELKKDLEEYQNNKIMPNQKDSRDSWPPQRIETNDSSLKHNQNIDQNRQNSARRNSSLNNEYLNKDFLQNNSKNQEQALTSINNFQSDSFKKKEHVSDIRSQRKYSKSPEHWKRRRRNKSQSSDSSHRGSSRSPHKRDELSVHQRKRSPNSDFSPKKRRQKRSGNELSSSQSRSRSSSYSSTSSSSSRSSSPAIRSVSSVIKPVRLENVKTEIQHDSKHANKKSHSLESDLSSTVPVKRYNTDDRFSVSSEISRDKTSVVNENRNHVTENTKRVPVHMRLGTFPRKRLIQMNKDVEAAFVTTSSDDETDVNIKCKKQNLRIVTEMYDSKTKGSCIIERKVEQDSNVSRERSRILKSSHR
ncbi:uncharacterized protein DDB_G0287625-like [Uloborus diversus]|uniref:uncharacterized protein DDB_G0287625-like n=1 Tax=Uloborus diversus TaxID=327109 RepID=UPI00240A1508|nr:uncharacterized protein DDB_G0287625-like [Uloborus diversus]